MRVQPGGPEHTIRDTQIQKFGRIFAARGGLEGGSLSILTSLTSARIRAKSSNAATCGVRDGYSLPDR